MRNIFTKRGLGIGALVIAGALTLGACSQSVDSSAQQAANQTDAQKSGAALHQLQIAQPIPQYNWSQYRETLIQIENAQANTVQTTSFFFNQGVADPIQTCPSIGFGIASTTELTNPLQAVDNSGGNGGYAMTTIGQVDPTGVYSGNSTGTYVVCVNSDGSNYFQYWEGFVDTVTGPAVWNQSTHSIQLTGPSTTHVNTKA